MVSPVSNLPLGFRVKTSTSNGPRRLTSCVITANSKILSTFRLEKSSSNRGQHAKGLTSSNWCFSLTIPHWYKLSTMESKSINFQPNFLCCDCWSCLWSLSTTIFNDARKVLDFIFKIYCCGQKEKWKFFLKSLLLFPSLSHSTR